MVDFASPVRAITSRIRSICPVVMLNFLSSTPSFGEVQSKEAAARKVGFDPRFGGDQTGFMLDAPTEGYRW
jgi:hypothetical protein